MCQGPPSLQSPTEHDGFFTAISIPELSPCSVLEPGGSDAVGLEAARVSRALMEAETVKGSKGNLGLPEEGETPSVGAQSHHGRGYWLEALGKQPKSHSSQSKYLKMSVNWICCKTLRYLEGFSFDKSERLSWFSWLCRRYSLV